MTRAALAGRATTVSSWSARPSPRIAYVLAALLGAAVACTGFPPFSNANTVLGVADRPWIVVAMPAALLAVTALLAALRLPVGRPAPNPHGLAAGAALLLLAGFVSIVGSDDPERSAVLGVLAISAPLLLYVGLTNARVPAGWLAAGFLVATSLMLLRADAVFVGDWGFPSTADLAAAKDQSVAYDFHYYTLGNPGHTAGFLLMPFTLAAAWAGDRHIARWQRALLVGAAALAGGTLILVYTRSAIASAVAVLVVLALVAPMRRRRRMIVLSAMAAATAAMIVVSFDYVAQLLDSDRNASVPERLDSLQDGMTTLADHPLTGVGLGQYGAGGNIPAHSSIVQAGAEMGVLGLGALLILTVAVCAHAALVVRRCGWFGLRPAAALAVAVYAVYAALGAPSSSGLFSDYVSVWGMSAALLLALSCTPAPEPA